MSGTTTAGDTAANTVPSIAAFNKSKCRKIGAKIISPKISKLAGTKHISKADGPTFFKSDIFKFNPARIKIIISAICRMSDEI